MAPKTSKKDIVVDKSTSTMDSGWAWVVAVAGMVIMLLSFGMFRTIGIFIVELMNVYETSTTEVSVILTYSGVGFSLSALLFMFGLGDLFHERALLVFAGLLSTTGFIVTYFSRKVEEVYPLGFCTGASLQIAYACSLAMIGKYFKKRLAIGNGIALVGVSLGTLGLPLFIRWAIDEYTYRGAALIVAGVSLNTLVFGVLMRPKSPFVEEVVKGAKRPAGHCQTPERCFNARDVKTTVGRTCSSSESVYPRADMPNCSTSESDGTEFDEHQLNEKRLYVYLDSVKRFVVKDRSSASKPNNIRRSLVRSLCFFKSPSFIFYQLFVYCSTAGSEALLQFYPVFTTELGMSLYQSAFLLSIVGGADLFGKIIFGLLGDSKILQRYKLVMVNQYIMGCACLLSRFATEFWSQIILAIIIGFFYGTCYSFRGVMLVDFFGLPTLLRRLGISNIVYGMASASGGPILGYIRDLSGNYNLPLQVVGAIFFISGTCLLATGQNRCCQERRKREVTDQKVPSSDSRV